jgi:AcrR family transcriptional regulator
MKEKIKIAATELFLNLGFKSVTMDDIANEMGISKKTIYTHFNNKTELVSEVTSSLFCVISEGIDLICAAEKNSIEELYEIKRFVMEHLKDEKTSPLYQLHKYYPKIYTTLKKKQFELMQDCVIDNLNRGVKTGMYRDNINVQFVARIYFTGVVGIKDNELFPTKMFPMDSLMDQFLEYHLRGICTPKGLETLQECITTINQSI